MLAQTRGMRICVLSELLVEPLDLGERVFVHGLVGALRQRVETVAIACLRSSTATASRTADAVVHGGRFFLSRDLRKAVRNAQPTHLVYISCAMLLPSSFFRTGVLRAYAGSVPIVLVGLQAAPLGCVARTATRLNCPDMVAVSAGMLESASAEFGRARVGVLPTGVDTVRFAPTDVETRTRLRALHGIDPDHVVYLHVGHLSRMRGLEVLQSLVELPRTTVVVVASNSTSHSTEVVHSLRAAGVRIEARVMAVEDWYRMADCYVFPVRSPRGCIDMPASVLEAMATNLPVVSTRFGALPKTFTSGGGLVFVDSSEELVRESQRLVRAEKPRTRSMVSEMGWLGTADALLALLHDAGEHES